MVLTAFSIKNFCAFQGLKIFIVLQIYDGLIMQVNNRPVNSGDYDIAINTEILVHSKITFK